MPKLIKKLFKTFWKNPGKIAKATLLIWFSFSLLFWGVYGVLIVTIYHQLSSHIIIKILSLGIPWQVGLLLNAGLFILNYLFFFCITLLLVHYKRLEL